MELSKDELIAQYKRQMLSEEEMERFKSSMKSKSCRNCGGSENLYICELHHNAFCKQCLSTDYRGTSEETVGARVKCGKPSYKESCIFKPISY
jgi:hypothetical protein